MTMSDELLEAARLVERVEGVPAAALLAVALVETSAIAFAEFDGRREPLVRFEGHYFDRRLQGADRDAARAAGLAHPRAGLVRNPASQAARWRLLDRAAAIGREAAFASTSFGLCQVMGAHHERLGFTSAEGLAAQARASIAGQFVLGARFLRREGSLDTLLLAGDFEGFARRYNGPGFRRNRYHTKIAAAIERARSLLGEAGPPVTLGPGSHGDPVAELQRALERRGYGLLADGVFGPRTEQAVRDFQQRHALLSDGIAGPRTWAALTR